MARFEFVTNIDDGKSEFDRSLDELCAYDVAPAEEKSVRSFKDIAFNVFRYGLILVFVGIFVVCVFMIADKSVDYARADNIYSELAEKFESDDFALLAGSEIAAMRNDPPEGALPSFHDRLDGKVPEKAPESTGSSSASKIEALKAMNPHAVGWIMVGGTRISLPVVQFTDNDYYLNVAFDGTENWAGTIFADYTNTPVAADNYNYVLYGHNMEGGQMFNDVTRFLDEEFFRANRYVTLYTEQGLLTYEIFSVFKAEEGMHYYRTQFRTGREFCDFAYDMKYSSLYLVDEVEFTEEDRIITLSTCTNENQKERYALQAKLVKIED